MQNLLNELIEALSKDDRLVSEGKLLKNKITELALNMDSVLLGHLLSSASIRSHFFTSVNDVLIFDKSKFIRFISNKEFLPDSYTSFKNKIGLVNANVDISEGRDVALVWPYKDCILEGGQTKEVEKRKEIFWNETLAPDEIDRLLAAKVFTGFMSYNKDGERTPDEDMAASLFSENLIIKGNNLLVLSSLSRRFAGGAKLIYIDPPYNTGSDEFGYNDTFNHSTWLTFMRNRLLIARGLLMKGGSIWVNIGEEEAHYLKVLMDEIFPKGFVATVVWQKRTSPDARKPLGDAHDYILVFSNDERTFRANCKPITLTEEQKLKFKNPDDDPKGPWVSTDFTATGFRPNQMYEIITPGGKKFTPPARKCWSKIESEYLKLLQDGRMWFGKNGKAMPRQKTYLSESEGITSWTWWDNREVGHNQEAKQESIALFGESQPFSTPKPERLIKRIIDICTEKGDLVIDFFAGSGTTPAVALKTGRKFIAIEQICYAQDYPVLRLKKVIEGETGGISTSVGWQGGGSFVSCELMKSNQAFIERIQTAISSDELLAIWKDMKDKAFISYKIEAKNIDDNIDDFLKLSFDEQKHLLIEILDKNLLYVEYSDIEDNEYKVSEIDKKLNRGIYQEV